jgi:hypothetical protein
MLKSIRNSTLTCLISIATAQSYEMQGQGPLGVSRKKSYMGEKSPNLVSTPPAGKGINAHIFLECQSLKGPQKPFHHCPAFTKRRENFIRSSLPC